MFADIEVRHIFVEKPMSLTPEESYNIMKILKDTNVKFVVGFNRRCAPIVKDAKAINKSYPTFFEDYNKIGGNSYEL